MVLGDWNELSTCSFEKSFPDIGGVVFSEVYLTRPKFVQFALIWKTCTGTYQKWKKYCTGRKKHEDEQKHINLAKISQR
jgi:hypothetical protein